MTHPAVPLRLIFVGLSFWLFAMQPTSAAAAEQPQSRPNVLVITIDTLRADHLGCYGYKQIHTPNIDRFAADAVKFEQAFTPVPITLPSHTVIFTGTYPTLNGMHDFSGNRLGADPETMASLLKARGYTTGAVVASAVLDSRFGLNRGFDFYYDHFDFNRLEEANLDEMERPGNQVADQVMDWLDKNRRNPFFLWMHLYDPHYPYRPPAPFNEEYKSHPYDGEIAFADEQVGRVLRFLQDKGLYRNSLIILSGDHGESLGDHGEATHGFFVYNATLHVPLLMHLPAPKRSAVGDIATPVSTADILPTVLRILEIPVPSQVQGESLLPLISGTKPNATRYLYGETFLPRLHFNWSELRAIESERYHFILAPKPELYDLSKDPKELQNLYSEKRAVADELKAKLAGFIRDYTAGQELAEKTGLDPALMERLKSLGYAGFAGGGPTVSTSDLPDPKDRIQMYELISQAIEASQHGSYEPSVEKLNTVLKTEPQSVPVHYLQGLNYYRLGEFPDAVEQFRKVLELSPDYALAAFHLALSYARTGQSEEAIATFKRTLELDSSNFSASYDLGLLYLKKNMDTEAAAAFRHSIQVAPDYLPGHMALGQLLLAQGQVDEAIDELRRAVALAPEQPAPHAALSKALASKGLRIEAQQEMRKAQEVGSPQ